MRSSRFARLLAALGLAMGGLTADERPLQTAARSRERWSPSAPEKTPPRLPEADLANFRLEVHTSPSPDAPSPISLGRRRMSFIKHIQEWLRTLDDARQKLQPIDSARYREVNLQLVHAKRERVCPGGVAGTGRLRDVLRLSSEKHQRSAPRISSDEGE